MNTFKPKKKPEALYLKGNPIPIAWACGTCGRVYARDSIQTCCATKICECGVEYDDATYTICPACRRQRDIDQFQAQIARAKKIGVEDYHGPVYSDNLDECYDDFGDAWQALLDSDDLHEIARESITFWACHVKPFSLGAGDIVYDELGNHFEGAEIGDDPQTELQHVLDVWIGKYAGDIETYEQDTTRMLVIPDDCWEEYDKELAEIHEEGSDAAGKR